MAPEEPPAKRPARTTEADEATNLAGLAAKFKQQGEERKRRDAAAAVSAGTLSGGAAAYLDAGGATRKRKVRAEADDA